jgi:hypothetical protein
VRTIIAAVRGVLAAFHAAPALAQSSAVISARVKKSGAIRSSNTATACIAATGIPSQQIMSTGALSFETRYTVRGSTAGTTTAANVEWLPFFVAPGSLTISLYGGHTAGNTGTFQNATLLVRAIS